MRAGHFERKILQDLTIEWVKAAINYNVFALKKYMELQRILNLVESDEEKAQASEILG